ncbi:peptidoglycan -binding protein [Limibaculum sp. M0105]|uniref:Peptidoglycan -binding protein n=1 Tax=Thermohalobaculum xanthum TaxID=2753746 RepID=A0A8J7M541_9RHOB|nr:peptidoglycan -binding protein [Thermohalobaculum xanthum]MBK0398504.1 peptidoglycan -binding protein [Thermohalobaculum xanthum]
MALTRRTGARFEATIWPGFVDALTALLLILMFVLSIFMIVQFSLRETVTGQTETIRTQEDELTAQATQIDRLSSQLAELADVLSLERAGREAAEAEAGELRSTLTDAQAEADRLDAALAAMTRARAEAEARTQELTGELAQTVDARDALAASLAAAREEIDEQTEAARLAAAKREAMEALIAELNASREQQDDEIAKLRGTEAEAQARLAEARESLTAEEEARALEAAAAEALRRRLEGSEAELDAMTLALESARKEAEETLTLLAAAEAAKRKLEQDQGQTESELSQAEALRRIAESELAEAEERTAEEARKAALLNQQVGALRDQLGSLQALLDDAAERDRSQKVQIAELGQKLNAALAQKVSELSRFRSEFFGRMREVLGGRSDIRVVGDRFVFQSEVLFAPGSSELNPAGIAELAKLGSVLSEVSKNIPEGLDWILRVDGHTDSTPVRGGGPFANWELSQARALSVVRYLVEEEGVPPERLAATGFGEYQPIEEGDSPDILARNRRIEFKFTER